MNVPGIDTDGYPGDPRDELDDPETVCEGCGDSFEYNPHDERPTLCIDCAEENEDDEA